MHEDVELSGLCVYKTSALHCARTLRQPRNIITTTTNAQRHTRQYIYTYVAKTQSQALTHCQLEHGGAVAVLNSLSENALPRVLLQNRCCLHELGDFFSIVDQDGWKDDN